MTPSASKQLRELREQYSGDRELINALLRGDEGTGKLISNWISQVIQVRASDYTDIQSEDIVSDTLYKLINNLREDKFRFESSLKTYVQRTTRFTVVDYIRARRKAREYVKRAGEVGELIAPESWQDDELALFSRILSLVETDCVKLWRMMILEGINQHEAAQKLGITDSEMEKRIIKCGEKARIIRERNP